MIFNNPLAPFWQTTDSEHEPHCNIVLEYQSYKAHKRKQSGFPGVTPETISISYLEQELEKLLLSCDPQDNCQGWSICAKNNGGKLQCPDVSKHALCLPSFDWSRISGLTVPRFALVLTPIESPSWQSVWCPCQSLLPVLKLLNGTLEG